MEFRELCLAMLPAPSVLADARGDLPDASLLADEEADLGEVSEGRRREFTIGRTCAHRALADLGIPSESIRRGRRGEPLWPPGVVGSITHCPGYCAAVVARSMRLLTLGIDAETHDKLPRGVFERVTVEAERRALSVLRATAADIFWDRVLFSAKESVYKAWFTLAGTWLGFEDAMVSFDPASCSFRARLLVAGPVREGRRLTHFDGRYVVADGLILTAVAVDAQIQGGGA